MVADAIDTDAFDHNISANLVGILSEIISNISDPREVIRELLSNACAREVAARNVEVSVFESRYGLSISVKDDGVGMEYTANNDSPGRLDRFLNIAYSEQSGFSADEFSYKGLGAKLLHNSMEVTVETATGGPVSYRVEIKDPLKSIMEKHTVSKPKIYRLNEPREHGTTITIDGWSMRAIADFQIDELKEYLQYYTVAGYTRDRKMPNIILNVKGKKETVQTGFPYIKVPKDHNFRTFVLDPAIALADNGVEITIKGGATVDTGENQLVEDTGGVWVAWRGIPYFKLDGRYFLRSLGIPSDFARFVIDSDNIRLNTSRRDFDYGSLNTDTFLELSGKGSKLIKESPEFKKFYKEWHDFSDEKLAQTMQKNKERLRKLPNVMLDDALLHKAPRNETDVAAILWKLEGKEKLPFTYFQTLMYAGSPKGIDLLLEIQETPQDERKEAVYCELEYKFSSFYKHKHNPAFTQYCICWEYDKKGFPDAEERNFDGKPWKHLVIVEEYAITVYSLKDLSSLKIADVR
jgi:hypothetical protein